jgi:excisionase family DNA binding protein
MAHFLTAQDMYQNFNQMPESEKKNFFELLFSRFFNAQDSDASHEQVFGHLKDTEFTAQEASEYLEVSISTFRRFVANKKLQPATTVGRNQLFAAADLKSFKRTLR